MNFKFSSLINRRQLQSLWYVPVLAMAMGLMLVRLLVVARLLTVQDFSVYGVGLLISSGFCMLACLGLQPLLQRELPVMVLRKRERAGAVLIMQSVIAAIFCAIVGLLFSAFNHFSIAAVSSWPIVIGLFHGLSQQLFIIATVDSRSRAQHVRFAQQNLVRAILVTMTGPMVVALGGSAFEVLAAEAIVTLAICAYLLYRIYYPIKFSFKIAFCLALRRIKKLNWLSIIALLAISFLSFLTMNVDRWIGADWLSKKDFGQYTFAWILLNVAQSVQMIINSAFYPTIVRRRTLSGDLEVFQLVAVLSFGMLIVGAGLSFVFWEILDYAIFRWYPAYADARLLLPAFLCIAVLRLSDFWTSYLYVIGKEVHLLLLNFFTILIVMLYWWLTTSFDDNRLNIIDIATLALTLATSSYLLTAVFAWAVTFSNKRSRQSV